MSFCNLKVAMDFLGWDDWVFSEDGYVFFFNSIEIVFTSN